MKLRYWIIVGLACPLVLLSPIWIRGQDPKPEPFTDEELLMQILDESHKLQLELDKTKKERDSVKIDLQSAREAHDDAQKSVAELTKKVQELTQWANQQAEEKDKALSERDKYKEEARKWEGMYHRLKWTVCLAIAAIAAYIAWKISKGLTFLGGWAWAAPLAAGAAAFSIAWIAL